MNRYYDAVLMDIRMPVDGRNRGYQTYPNHGAAGFQDHSHYRMTANAFDSGQQEVPGQRHERDTCPPIRVEELLGMLDACL